MQRPFIGHGVGLRLPHYEEALKNGLEVDWVEVISENFMRPGGRPRAVIERLRRDMPIVMHGVSMGIGSVAPLDETYVRNLRRVADELEPAWVSDHLCWSRHGSHHAHDLLPLPYTEEALRLVAERISRAQELLGRRLVIENVSSYVGYNASEMTEWDFLAEIARRADCLLLLDLNNVVVSAVNHGFAPSEYLAALPSERIWQFHLANHDRRPNHRFDSHRGAVPEEVWQLFDEARARFGDVSTLIEWDEDVPTWDVLLAEQQKAKALAARPLPPLAAPHASYAVTPHGDAPDLATSQDVFWHAITWPMGVAALCAADAEAASTLARTFAESPAFLRTERLELYADAYFWRLYEVLANMFALTASQVGQTNFQNLVTDYLLAEPSRSPDVGDVGSRLPDYLALHGLAAQFPHAAALARVEWHLARALHGPDDTPATTDDLTALPSDRWPQLRLRAVATLRVVACPIDTRALAADGAEMAPAPRAHWPLANDDIVVWRKGFVALHRPTPPREAAALRRLADGCTFDDVCQCATDPAEAAGWLASWLEDRIVAISS